MRRIILRSHQSPGDIVMLTAAVRELHRACPGQFQTDVRTSAAELWAHNPHVTPLQDSDPGVEHIDMHYPLIHQSNERPYHFVHGYVQYLEERFGLRIPVTRFAGDIHLSEAERTAQPRFDGEELPERYWVLMAGGKYDFTAKWWNPESYQAVVDHFRGRLQFVQCGEAGHWHPPLTGVINLVGKTSLREFVQVMHFADGVVCPVTLAMHLAAAVPLRSEGPPNRACIVLAGGREPPQWEAYPQHQFLHTIGQLDCCRSGGCWKSRCQPVGDGDSKDRRNRCERPVSVREDLVIPQCLELIRPEDVISAIERTLTGWSLSRHDQPVTAAKVSRRPPVPARPLNPPTPKRIRIDFRHGLGDAIQFTAVLRHLRHYHPDWQIDVAALRGKHSAFQGLCHQALILDAPQPPTAAYDQVYRLDWDECRTPDGRWPNTKVTRCLQEIFRLTPLPDLCRYELQVSPAAHAAASNYLTEICGAPAADGRFPAVLIHYEGNTSGEKKNLTHAVIREVCQTVLNAGHVPVILDWDRRSPLPDGERIFCPGKDHPLWRGMGTGDAEQLAALIAASRLMIGIDSGPLHVAGATATDTLGVWTRHHPLNFFDLAPHVEHLVPEGHADLIGSEPALGYFRKAYRSRTYQDLLTELPALVAGRLAGAQPETAPGEKFRHRLQAKAYSADYYLEHQRAGLDYLNYGDWQRDYGRWFVEALSLQGRRLLDVGCACGALMRGFGEAGAVVQGVDLNEHMLQLGRKQWPDMAPLLHVCDAVNLHLFPEGQWDAIHTAQVAEHWKPELVPYILKELARVTAPGGLLFCCLDTEELFARQGRRVEDEDPTHICVKPRNWWHELLPAAGWELCTAEFTPALQNHPASFLKRYDWDWFVARKVAAVPQVAQAKAESPRVSIVIAARNNGRYLAEALESALQQSHSCEVIYADDGSHDDSRQIAAKYEEQGLVIVQSAGHAGVCAARNRGARVARGDYLVFLDGDDRLPTDFVTRHLQAIAPGVPFAYGPALAFGEGPHAGTLWTVPEWSQYDRWQTNTVNTSALYARWAFEAAGGWQDRVHTMWDWDLALRASRLGTPRTSTATLDYRQHPHSWSALIDEKTETGRSRFLGDIRRANARLSIGAILSGRLPELLPRWWDALVQSLGWLELPQRPELVLLDNSQSAEYRQQLESLAAADSAAFSTIRIIPYPERYTYSDERSRQDAVASFMARASARLKQETQGDILWFVEDDILVPLLAARDLWRTLTEGWTPPAIVAGCYRNRHVPEQYVGGWWRDHGPEEVRDLSPWSNPFEVDFTGTGCAMSWTHLGPRVWESHDRGVPAHDWAWCAALRGLGRKILMHPGVRCGHAITADEVLVS